MVISPRYVTTIEQHVGTNLCARARMTRIHRVITDYADHSSTPWDSLSDVDRAWWDELLGQLHAAEVEIASLDADLRHEAERLVITSGQLDALPQELRMAIGRAKEAVTLETW